MGKLGSEILATLYTRIIVENKSIRSWIINVTVVNVSTTHSSPVPYVKIHQSVLDGRILIITSTTPNQCSFTKECGLVDALHVACLLVERNTERKTRKSIWRFIGSPWTDELIWMAFDHTRSFMSMSDGPVYFIRNSISIVHCSVGISPAFHISVGFHQGSCLMSFLFILCMDTALMWVILQTSSKHIFGCSCMLMTFYSQMKSVRPSMAKYNSGKIGWIKRDYGSILQRQSK